MRGSSDDTIEAGRTPVAGQEEIRRPPGGKALLRLIQLLESSGYTETANSFIARAVGEEDREEFRTRAARFTIVPGEESGGSRPSASSSRSKRSQTSEESGTTEAENVAQIYHETAKSLAPPTPTGPQWRSLGPWTVPNGQTYGASRVNISGRISAIAIDPANPAHVLAGAANGGVWESFDRGGSWQSRTDYAATLTVGAITFDPHNSSTVYCGTGEGNWWSWLGAGILRSTNGGTTWSTLCTTPFVGQGFYDLIVDPGNSLHLIAGTTGGLYVSNDGGINWTQQRTATTWSLSIAPAGGASAEILAACGDGLWQSTNGGTTWTAVTLPSSPGSFNRLATAIARSNPAVAYAWGASGANAYLWHRASGTWTAVGAPPGVNVGQAWYDWYLAVAPDLDTQIYCGAIDAHRGDLSGSTWTWLNLSSKSSGDSIHPDQHAIAFEPGQPNTIYAGNDGGLFRSPDRGITWQHCNNGLVITEFEYLAQDYGSSRWLIGGTQDNGTERWTGSPVFYHAADGDGGWPGVNRTNPTEVFHTYYGMSLERSTSRGDFGTWSWIAPPLVQGEGSSFYPPFASSATTGDTIAMGGTALHISRDGGTNWIVRTFPAAATSSTIYIPNADTVYVATTDGRVYRTDWSTASASWGTLTALTTPRANAYISDLYVDPNNTNRMWATSTYIGGGRVFLSVDGGSSWTDRTTGLPNLPITGVEVDTWNANRVWVAADLGVYQSTDGGATWADFSNALPNAFVGDLLFHPHARVLRAGMRNRGIWEIPVDGWITEPICGTQWTGSLAGNQSGRWYTWGWPATWNVVWTIMPTNPRPGSPQVSWTIQVERANAEYATYWITVRNLTPDPLTFEGRYCILSRY